MLSSRVSVPLPPDQTQEDFFSASISSLFTDDTINSHGTPGQAVIYHSPRHGEIKLGIPQHPDVEEGRNLFAHYLWNAGVVAADAIESASYDDGQNPKSRLQENNHTIWHRKYWNMQGMNVLELGAGTSLPSIISAKSGARSVTITDHPSSPALTTNTISQNVHENLRVKDNATTITNITIAGLTWGDTFFTSATHYGKLLDPQPAQHTFDKIIIADCLWMPSQHQNLIKTIRLWLCDAPESESELDPDTSPPCALIIAGFHTGRATIASFFEIATSAVQNEDADSKNGGKTAAEEHKEEQDIFNKHGLLSIAQIFEVDVDLNVREWVAEREDESKEQLKRWCVVAVLVRKNSKMR